MSDTVDHTLYTTMQLRSWLRRLNLPISGTKGALMLRLNGVHPTVRGECPSGADNDVTGDGGEANEEEGHGAQNSSEISDFEGFEEQMTEAGEVVNLHDNRSEQMRENERQMNEDTNERQMSDNWQMSDNRQMSDNQQMSDNRQMSGSLSEDVEKTTDKNINHAQNNDRHLQTNEHVQVSASEQVGSFNQRELELMMREMAILRREKELLEKENNFYKQKEKYQKLVEAAHTCNDIRSADNNNEVPQSSTNSNNNDETQDNGRANNRSTENNSNNDSIGQCNNNSGVQNDGKLSFGLLKELVPEYDGSTSPEIFVTQFKNLAILYSVDDSTLKALLMTKVKGKVQTWLHSKKNFVHEDVNKLLGEVVELFRSTENKLLTRRKFETRMWKFGEEFVAYYNEKNTMGENLGISEDELIDYLIEGIPDETLKVHANLQCFKHKGQLLAALSKITLKQPNHAGKNVMRDVRCYNCNCLGHYASSCQKPKREVGACYGCGSVEHLVTVCPQRKSNVTKSA